MEVLIQNFAFITIPHVIMWVIGGVLIYLAIAKEMEPTLLLFRRLLMPASTCPVFRVFCRPCLRSALKARSCSP